jgi:hypothetical protein
VQLLGRWPAKLYLVVDIPEDVGALHFLRFELAAFFAQAGVQGWAFPDGVARPSIGLQVSAAVASVPRPLAAALLVW